MKTIKSILIGLAMVFMFVNTAMADEHFSVIKVVDKKIYLSLDDVTGKTTVSITNREGATLMKEEVGATTHTETVFDLENLPVGSYSLIIKSESKETIQPIKLTTRDLIIDESNSTSYFPVNFTQRRGSLTISFLNPTNSVVRVYVLDQTGRKIYQDEIKDQMVIDKEYNFKKQLPAGGYTVVVDNAMHNYTKNIKL